MSEKTPSARSSGRPASFKLLSFAAGEKPLAPGEPVNIAPGARITVDPQSGDALLEVGNAGLHGSTSGATAAAITVGGEKILDVSHVTPGQEITINGVTWVYLRPMQVLFHTGRSRRDRIAALREGLALAGRADLADAMTIDPSSGGPLAKGEALSRRVAEAGAGYVPPSVRRRAVRTATYASAGIVAALIVAGMLDRPDGASAQKNPRVSQRESATPVKTAASPATKVAPVAPAVPAQAASVVSPNTESSREVPVPASASGPASGPIAAAAAAPVAQTAKAAVAPRPSSAPGATAGKPSKADESKLRASRQRFAEYNLEARFDPDGAARKMEALARELPAGSPLAVEIRKRIQGLAR